MKEHFSPADYAGKLSRNDDQLSSRLNRILTLERAAQGEFDVTQREAQAIRRRIYGINKHHPRGYRFRTMRDGSLLLVWRIK